MQQRHFLRYAETNIYPDGNNPWTFALTSTFTVDPQGTFWPVGCGHGCPDGLYVCHAKSRDKAGMAVALPPEGVVKH